MYIYMYVQLHPPLPFIPIHVVCMLCMHARLHVRARTHRLSLLRTILQTELHALVLLVGSKMHYSIVVMILFETKTKAVHV